MNAPPVVVEHLTKTFGPGRGITDVSMTIDAGQVFGFLGPNGAGKSTTIRCLLGLYRPDSGRARVLGHDPAADAAALLADVGYLPGELHLPDALTGASILARFGRARHLADTAYRDELCDRFGVELDRRVATLSKGNKQKIGLVLAFMHRPRLLVLDEPTSGLDPLLQDEFATLLRETRRQRAHRPALVAQPRRGPTRRPPRRRHQVRPPRHQRHRRGPARLGAADHRPQFRP